MKRLILLIIFLLFTVNVYADQVTMPQYGPTSTLTNVNLNERWNLLTNEINGNLDNTNADTDGGFRFVEILSSLPAAGNQGRVVFDTGNNTLNFDTGFTFLATALLANSQTFTGTNTFTGAVNISGLLTVTGNSTFAGTTIADLGIVTTSVLSTTDINDGTMDNVQVDGSTTEGMLFVTDSSNDLSELGSQGTAGQILQSAGAGAAPTFVTQGLALSSTADFTIATTISITIADDSQYLLVIDAETSGSSSVWRIRFDASSNSVYSMANKMLELDATPNETTIGASSQDNIALTQGNSIDVTKPFLLNAFITTNAQGSAGAMIEGNILTANTSDEATYSFTGITSEGTTSSIDFTRVSGTGTLTGSYFLYEYGQ